MVKATQLFYQKIKQSKSNFRESDIETVVKQKQTSCEAMLVPLYAKFNFSIQEIYRLIDLLLNEARQNQQFSQWLGETFKLTWLKVRVSSLFKMNIWGLDELMKFNPRQPFDQDNVLKNFSDILSKEDPLKIQKISKQISQSQNWKELCKIYKPVNQQDQRLKQLNQYIQDKLANLVELLKQSKNSILDELIQNNLKKAFENQYLKTQRYSKSDYDKFKNQLLQLATKLGVCNHQLKYQLDSDLAEDQGYYDKIINVRSKIHPIYIPDLMYLIDKNKATQKVVCGKDIIVILGVSGAGKSTLVQMMLGYKQVLKKGSLYDKQLTTLVPVGGLKNQHKEFVAKASSKSVTKYVSAIQLQLPQPFDNKGTVFIADTPGFFDSQGVVVDANNSLSTIRTLSMANSIRFILMINYKGWGLKGEGFKKLAKLLSKLFKEYDQSKVVYFLNCINKQELSQLPKKIKDLRQKLNEQEKGDNKFLTVVDHFNTLLQQAKQNALQNNQQLGKAIRNSPQLYVMNPEQPNMKEAYKKILDSNRKVEYPSKYLQNILSQEVRVALKNQVSNINTIIRNCIILKKMDAALYYINILVQLAQQTKQIDDVASAQKKITVLIQQLEQDYDKQYKRFENYLQRSVKYLKVDEQTMRQNKQLLDKLQQLQKNYKLIPGMEHFGRVYKTTEVIADIKNQFLKRLESEKTSQLIETIIIFSRYFGPQMMNEFVQKMKDATQILQKQIKNMINSQKYQNLDQLLNKSNQNLKLCGKIPQFNYPFKSWKTLIQHQVNIRVEKFSRIQQMYKNGDKYIGKQDLEYLQKSLQILSVVDSNSTNLESIYSTFNQIRKQTLNLGRVFIKQIRQFIKEGNEETINHSISKIMQCKQNVKRMLDTITFIKDQIKYQLDHQLSNLHHRIQSKISIISNQSQKIGNQNWIVLKSLHNSIQFLKRISLIAENQQLSKCKQSIVRGQQIIAKKLSQFQDQIKVIAINIDISTQNLSIILNAYKINIGSDNRQNNVQFGQDKILKYCKNIKSYLKDNISNIIKTINNFIQNELKYQNNPTSIRGNIYKIKKINKFFNQIKFTNFKPIDLNTDIIQTRTKFGKQLHNTINSIQKEVSLRLKNYSNVIIAKRINQEISQPLCNREQMDDLNLMRSILSRIKQDSSLKTLLDQVQYNDEDIIERSIKDLNVSINNTFHTYISNNFNLKETIEFVDFCQPLKYLDDVENNQRIKFQQSIRKLKKQIDQSKTDLQLDLKPKDFINSENISIYHFQRIYRYLSSFQPPTPQGRRLNSMMQQICNVIREYQKSLLFQLKKRPTINQPTQQLIQNIYEKISKVLNTVKQINEEIKEQEMKVKINQETIQKMARAGLDIINACQKKINKNIEEGGSGYAEADNTIGKIRYIQQIFIDLRIPELQASINQKKASLRCNNIYEFYEEKLKSIKEQRFNRYLGFQNIQITDRLMTDFDTFDIKQKIKISNKICEQFQRQTNQILQRNLSKSENQFKNELGNLLKAQSRLLPEGVRQRVGKIVETAGQHQLVERKLVAEQADRKYQYKQCWKLIEDEDKPYLIKVYENRTKQILQQTLSGVKQLNTIEQIIAKIQEVYINPFKQIVISEKQKFKKIYNPQATNLIKYIQVTFINKSLKQFPKLLNEKYIDEKKQSAVDLIRRITHQFITFTMLFSKNKNQFQGYNANTNLMTLQDTLNKFKARLMKKNDELTLAKIRKQSNKLTSWYYQSLCFSVCVQQITNNSYQLPEEFSQFTQDCNKLTQKYQSLKADINNIIAKINQVKLYSEAMKNNSDQQRGKIFENLQQNLQILQSLNKSSAGIFRQNFGQLLKQTVQLVRTQIVRGIEQSCSDIQADFDNVEKQFSKSINVSLSIINIAAQKLPFIKIQSQEKERINKKIQQKYLQYFQSLDNGFTIIQPLKKEYQNKIRQIKTKSNEFIEKQKIQFSEKVKKIKDQLKIDQQNQTDPQKIKRLQIRCKNQTDLYHKDYIQAIKSNEDKSQSMVKKQQRKLQQIIQKYGIIIIIIFKATFQINYKQTQYKRKLDNKLTQHSQILGKRVTNQIYEVLKSKGNNYAIIMINSHQIFKNNQAIQWQAKVKGNGIQYVLENLNVTAFQKSSLKDLFNKYQHQFDTWTKKYQSYPTNTTIKQLHDTINIQAGKIKSFYHAGGNASLAEPEKLLAQIFALWTIMNSFIQDDIVSFSYQPHPAQVVAIFLCLSFLRQDNTKRINSKMAQIGTGEGKSVVLAGLSSYLALCGFQVNSVCYSGYLSTRDRQAFAPLFQKLQISSKIIYGTFDSVCQSLLNKQTPDFKGFRSQIKEMLIQQKSGFFDILLKKLGSLFKSLLPINDSINSSNKIMLIDEVDVFFNPEFFGSLYCPDVTISSDQISQLMKFVWHEFNKNPTISDHPISSSKQFKEVTSKYGKIKELLKSQVRGMILGCRGCEHDYVVRDDLIQYKDQDGISSKINYGFQTLFAYLKQYERNKVSKSSLQKALNISLIVAEFSYSQLPKYFRSIIGVTGTYEDMLKSKKDYMRTAYDVKASYVIPSVYGNTRRRLINQPKIVQPQKHWEEIIKEIKQINNTGRPVLVFFKNASELQNFFNSPLYIDLQFKTTFLNQTHSASDRDMRIKKTCNKGNITLMTNSFGRGTDFIVYDETIFEIDHGGLHVIQTFISVDQSQQIQIQGRTARQGNPGTYSLIIPTQDLQLLDLKLTGIQNFNKQVRNARSIKQDKQWSESLRMFKDAQFKHKRCIDIYLNPKIEQKQIIEYIGCLNQYQEIRSTMCKTVILVDATGSMSGVLKKLLSILGQVVKDIIQITSEFSSTSSSQLQLGVYRNYNCSYETLFQVTPFQSQAINLLKFLKGVKADGGLGHEAIQVAFNHVNNLPEVDQVIIIGDAPANNQSQTVNNRKSQKGENYWLSKNIPLLSSQVELNYIANKKIPIHSFYINTQPSLGTQAYFTMVSNVTGGQCQLFKVDADDSSKRLSQFIAERILEKVASDRSQADQMVTIYRKRHSL